MNRLKARHTAIAALWKARFHSELPPDADLATVEAILIDGGISRSTIDAVALVEFEKLGADPGRRNGAFTDDPD